MNQRFGLKGLSTRLDDSQPKGLPGLDDVESKIKAEKLRHAQLMTSRLEEQDRLRRGVYIEAMAARAEMARLAAEMLKAFEGALPDFASGIAAKLHVPSRDALHVLRGEFRRACARLAAFHAFSSRGANERPFDFVLDRFEQRRRIKNESERAGKYDIREKAIKLSLNSIYGKLAQSVGREGRPPAVANPYYAAATTAYRRRRTTGRETLASSGSYTPASGRTPSCHRTNRLGSRRAMRPSQCIDARSRRLNRLNFRCTHRPRASLRWRLIEAALLDPHAIVFFATDGIVSTRELQGLSRVRKKGDAVELGDWEYSEADAPTHL